MNQKKLFHLFVLLFAAGILFTACDNDVRVTGVTLNRTTLELTVGGSETLIATIMPADATNRSVAWTSSDEQVATVNNNGVVTAISAGTAVITVTTADGAHTAACTVTVSEATVAVTGVALNPAQLTMTVGAPAVTLIATVLPDNATNKTVAWTSGNPAVASVDSNGSVTALSPGTATITVVTADGAHTAYSTVTVNAATIAVTGVTLNYTIVHMWINGSVPLTATVLPADATNRNVIWSSSNTQIATVDNTGRVTGLREGTATITVTTVDGNRTANSTVTVFNPATHCVGVVINGVRWATRNVDRPGTFVTSRESFGMFYQWNRNVGWSSTNPMVNSNGGTSWNTSTPAGTSWTAANDPCPPGWRVPTQAELNSLINSGSFWATLYGVFGEAFGNHPNQIFLPAAGARNTNGTLGGVGTVGYYWTSTQGSSTEAWGLEFRSDRIDIFNNWSRRNAMSIRCVAQQQPATSAYESDLYQPQISITQFSIPNEVRIRNGLIENKNSESSGRELQISAP